MLNTTAFIAESVTLTNAKALLILSHHHHYEGGKVMLEVAMLGVAMLGVAMLGVAVTWATCSRIDSFTLHYASVFLCLLVKQGVRRTNL